MNIPTNELIDNPCEYMTQLAITLLPLQKWNFQESKKLSKPSPTVIYNSEWCRISLIWDGWEMYTGNSISILYGKLHAPDDEHKMVWHDEECYCWHRLSGVGAVLDYLDGLSPQAFVSRNGFPRVIADFRQSELWQNLAGKRRDPELKLRMEAAIWNHY